VGGGSPLNGVPGSIFDGGGGGGGGGSDFSFSLMAAHYITRRVEINVEFWAEGHF
jgi:hypothetical protein